MINFIENYKAIIGVVSAVIALCTGTLGVYKYLETRYALNSKLVKIEKRLEMQIINDEIYQIQDRIWYLQDKINAHPDNRTAKEELRILSFKKEKLDEELDDLYKSFR